MKPLYKLIAVLLFVLSFSALMPSQAAHAQGPDLTIAKITRNGKAVRVNVRNGNSKSCFYDKSGSSMMNSRTYCTELHIDDST